MRIYLTGSHCTGKSTLAKELAKIYDIPKIDETSRAVMRKEGWDLLQIRSNPILSDYFEELVMKLQVEEEKALNLSSFVSDRAFDFVAYTAEHASNLWSLRRTPEWKWYFNWIRRGDAFIFFIRPSTALLDYSDPEREPVSWEGMQRIDAGIKFFLEWKGLRYWEITTDIFEERVRFVQEIIERERKRPS